MKTMIRSFASALVAVMTLGLVQTAQAEPCSIEQLVEPEGVCTITQDKTQAEGGEEVKFTISNIKEGYQVEEVKVFLYGEGGEIYPDYNYEEDYYSFNMPEENVYIYVRCEKPTTEYSITIPEFKGGSVTSDVTSAEAGAPVKLTVTPDKGYELASILVVGDGVTIEPKGEGSTYIFEMPPSAVTVQATFKEKLYKINIPEFKGGTVTSNVASTNEGATVTLTVTPDPGYELDTIKVDGIDPEKGEGSTYTFEMPPSDVTVMATFKEKLYKINIPEFKGGTVTSNVASTNEGATVTLTVTPDAGYELDSITVDGLEPTKGEGSTYTFEMPNHDVEVAATFKEATKYKIDTSVTPSEACEVHVQDSAQSGADVYFEVGNFAAGATLGSITVWNMSVGGVPVEYQQSGKGYTFKMPDGDVLIQVFCSDPEPPKDPEILDVTAQQRYPWNGLVDIGYTVTGTIPDGYVLKVSAMDMKTYDTFDAKTITAEEFPLSEGSHTLKWDMNADGYTTEVSDSIFFMVSAESAAGASFGATSSTVKLDLRTGTTREIALGATETLTYSTDYEGGPTPPVQEGVQLWENGPYFAETNIGAKNPQDYGYYFWWGDTVGYQYSDMAWTAVDGSGKVITFDDNAPANSTTGKDLEALMGYDWIDKTSHNLLPGHDAATAHLGPSWRMPTGAEFQQLVDTKICTWDALKDEDGNLIGYTVTGATDGYTDKSIFLPAAGIGSGSDLSNPGSLGFFWSSSPDSGSQNAKALYFNSGYVVQGTSSRCKGFPIRPVQSATASAAANGASNEGETVTITVNGKPLKSGLIESGTIDWTPTEPGEYELHHIVKSSDGATEITNLVARYNVQAPPTTVAVIPYAADNTSVGGVYTNGIAIASTAEGTYIVDLNATVDVVFDAAAGYFFKKDGAYTPVVTNTTTAAADPTEVFGPTPNQGTQVGDSAYAFVDGATCTIVGSGTADTRLSTVVSPGAITSVVIQPGITEIGARFFKDFKWLNAVTGGQDLATVGEKAFYACFSLVTIDLDCTAVPKGMDGAVVYQTALKSDGSTYQIPEISVKNHVKMLFGKKSLNDADWTCLGPSEGRSIYEQDGYQFFQIRLVPEE